MQPSLETFLAASWSEGRLRRLEVKVNQGLMFFALFSFSFSLFYCLRAIVRKSCSLTG